MLRALAVLALLTGCPSDDSADDTCSVTTCGSAADCCDQGSNTRCGYVNTSSPRCYECLPAGAYCTGDNASACCGGCNVMTAKCR